MSARGDRALPIRARTEFPVQHQKVRAAGDMILSIAPC